jgi:pimeloyl-ACP methyl ester carboxylesterase
MVREMSIHHETIGTGADVILIHGLTDSSLTWGPITGMLAEQYRVTTLDLRGMGRSDDPPGGAHDYSAIAMVDDVVEVVAAAELTSPLVIGHSLGGVVATAYSARHDVRGTVNVDQSLHLSGFKEALMQVEPLLRDPATFAPVIEAVFAGLDGDQLPDVITADIALHRRTRQEVVLGVWDQVFSLPVAELDALMAQLTAGLTTPYLSLHYADLGHDYAAWLHRLIPQAIVEHPKPPKGEYGHYGHRIDPDRFVQRVLAFDRQL